MSRVLLPKVFSDPAPTGPQVLFPTGSFVTWNKTGDKLFVVCASQYPNMHAIRSLPSPDGLYKTYTANGENLTLIQSGNTWHQSPLSEAEKEIVECPKSEMISLFKKLMPTSPDQDLYHLFNVRKIKTAESKELIRAYNIISPKELNIVERK